MNEIYKCYHFVDEEMKEKSYKTKLGIECHRCSGDEYIIEYDKGNSEMNAICTICNRKIGTFSSEISVEMLKKNFWLHENEVNSPKISCKKNLETMYVNYFLLELEREIEKQKGNMMRVDETESQKAYKQGVIWGMERSSELLEGMIAHMDATLRGEIK